MGSSGQDFQSLVMDYGQEYDSARNLAEQKLQEATQIRDVQGSELINLAGMGGLSLLGRAITRAGVAGKISRTLDDFEGKMGPIGRAAFRTVRQVGSDILGMHGKVGEISEKIGLGSAIKPKAPSEIAEAQPEPEEAPDWRVSIKNEMAPMLEKIGQAGLAGQALAEGGVGSLTKTTAMQIHESLVNSGDEAAQALAGKMVEAANRTRAIRGTIEQNGTTVTDGLDEAVARPLAAVAGEAAAPVLDRVQDSLSQIRGTAGATPQLLSTQNRLIGENPSPFGLSGKQTRPAPPDDEFSDEPITGFGIGRTQIFSTGSTLLSGAASVAGLAAGQLTGKANTALSMASFGGQTAADFAQGELPVGAVIAGAQMGLQELGQRGVEASQGLGLTAAAAGTVQSIRGIYGAAKTAASGAVQAGEKAATDITAGVTPENLTGAVGAVGEELGGAIGSSIAKVGATIAGAGTDALAGTTEGLADTTAISATLDENPVGIGITAALGLATAVTGLAEGIRDLFHHASMPSIPKPALPSFQAGIAL